MVSRRPGNAASRSAHGRQRDGRRSRLSAVLDDPALALLTAALLGFEGSTVAGSPGGVASQHGITRALAHTMQSSSREATQGDGSCLEPGWSFRSGPAI